jgi:NAD(P)-dependent dehydrogenase (short-subunit alcohol dehydrogenase family)
MGLLDGKVVVVTGAGRGQGRSHSIRMAREGASLLLIDIGDGQVSQPDYPTASAADLRQTAELVEAEGGKVLFFEADVRDYDRLCAAVNEGVRHFGYVDSLVANAGIGDAFYPTWELPNQHWQTMIDVNLTGVFYTCKAVIPHMRASGRPGSIVLVSSAVVFRSAPYLSHYNAAKAGVRSLSATLARELGPDGIRCNSLHPGAIITPMTDAMSTMSGLDRDKFLEQFLGAQLLKRLGQCADTTAAVTWLLSDEAAHVTAMEFSVDGGESAN